MSPKSIAKLGKMTSRNYQGCHFLGTTIVIQHGDGFQFHTFRKQKTKMLLCERLVRLVENPFKIGALCPKPIDCPQGRPWDSRGLSRTWKTRPLVLLTKIKTNLKRKTKSYDEWEDKLLGERIEPWTCWIARLKLTNWPATSVGNEFVN